MYFFSLFSSHRSQHRYTTYRITDDPIDSYASRVIFIYDEQNNREKCLKLWLPVKDDLYDTIEPEMRIKYLLEGLKYNRRFARNVYLGIMEIKQESVLKLGLLMKKQNKSTLEIKDELIELGPLMKWPSKKRLEPTKEYALVMKRLDNRWRLDEQLSRGALATKVGIAFLAKQIAKMHKKVDRTSSNEIDLVKSISGKLAINIKCYKESLQKASLQEILLTAKIKIERYEWIVDLLKQACDALTSLFQQRCDEGYVKRCHGDLKTTNLWIRSRLLPFLGTKRQLLALDCIDFKDEFCYIDTLSDVAMLAIDLEVRLLKQNEMVDQPSKLELAKYFLDTYLREMDENNKHVLPILEYYMTEKSIICAFMSILYEDDPLLGVRYLEVGLVQAHALAKRLEASGNLLPAWKAASPLDAHSKWNHSG